MDGFAETFALATMVAAMPESHDDEFARRTMQQLVTAHPRRAELEKVLVFVAMERGADSTDNSALPCLLSTGAEELVHLASEFS